MRVLAVDTALAACSVAILSGDVVLAHRFEEMERGHAEALAPMVEQAMGESGIEFSALDRLGVTSGPGTFTGMRVGLAFTRGLKLALKVPLIGVTSLFAMAKQAMEETGLACAASVHGARQEEVYFEIVHGSKSDGPLLLPIREAAARVAKSVRDEPVVLAGSAQSRLRALIAGATNVVTSKVVVPDARWVARLAAAATEIGPVPKPFYLRPPAAKIASGVK